MTPSLGDWFIVWSFSTGRQMVIVLFEEKKMRQVASVTIFDCIIILINTSLLQITSKHTIIYFEWKYSRRIQRKSKWLRAKETKNVDGVKSCALWCCTGRRLRFDKVKLMKKKEIQIKFQFFSFFSLDMLILFYFCVNGKQIRDVRRTPSSSELANSCLVCPVALFQHIFCVCCFWWKGQKRGARVITLTCLFSLLERRVVVYHQRVAHWYGIRDFFQSLVAQQMTSILLIAKQSSHSADRSSSANVPVQCSCPWFAALALSRSNQLQRSASTNQKENHLTIIITDQPFFASFFSDLLLILRKRTSAISIQIVSVRNMIKLSW